MSYTLTIEPEIVKEAESCAVRNSTTLDAMIRACMLVLVARGRIDDASACSTMQGRPHATNTMKIGSMKDEINLPEDFDEKFDSMDEEVSSMFGGAVL